MVDDDLKIDFCADTLTQMQRFGRHMAAVRTILFTHPHLDHFAPGEMQWMQSPFTNTPPAEVDVYGNAAVIAELKRIAEMHGAPANRRLHEFAAGMRFTTATGDEVLALPADHAPGSCVLRIRRAVDGRTLFYGHDSGLYPAETLDGLSDGVTLDVALFDCTSGGCQTTNRGHMSIEGVIRMANELRQRNVITPKTRCIATHFSHNGRLLHEELVTALLPHGIEVAFDGMVIEV